MRVGREIVLPNYAACSAFCTAFGAAARQAKLFAG
jgi:hypothetical protein